MNSAAIVTTLKDQGPSLLTFVTYHLAIGFSKIYLMFDDPLDSDQELVKGIPGVEVLPCDSHLRGQWPSLHKYKKYGDFVNSEVRARQTLNAELAMRHALEDGMDWLLHIDSDELFWLSESTIHNHLLRLQEASIVSARYFNFEAIPEGENIDDCFLEVRAFKKPAKLLLKQGVDYNEYWPSNRKYFNFYTNGKSMCQVREDMVPGDVHKWSSKTEYIHTSSFYHPCVLHYSCCGYTNFESKYKKLIDNGNSGIEFGVPVKDKGFALDYDSICAYLKHDEKTARQIYRDRVMMDAASIDHLVEQNVVELYDIKAKLER